MKMRGFLVACLALFCILGVCEGGDLRKKFYKRTCSEAEDIVRSKIQEHVSARPELPAKLIRMHFHDCFVRGCDGSVLLDSTASNTAEKDSIPNLSLSGFDVIDDIKAALEAKCPGTVSCADILALAARDAVSVQFKKPMWEVLTGRRDGKVSISGEALANLPAPFFNLAQLRQSFESKKLTVHDLVVLSGAHTIGVGHCNLFSNRLFNFSGKGDQDPSLNPTYATFLKTKCQSLSDTTTTVEMDPESSSTFDNDYYSILIQNKGLFQSDAALLTAKVSRNIVNELTKQDKFFTEFGQSMKRMGAIEVLTGSDGEIRTKCSHIIKNIYFVQEIELRMKMRGGDLRKKFYKRTCSEAEDIVRSKIQEHVSARPELAAKLIRMHFHDCFVRGCDGSVLLDSTATNTAEKDSIPNLSLSGFDVIDDIKAALEAKCPGTVSCADILALAARDAVSVQFKKPMWEVLTGRRDGKVSISGEALANLPAPFFNITQLRQSFESKKLTVHDLVVLSGAHTIGVGHCNLFSNRLFNFSGKGDQDPSLNPTYATFLKTKCQSLSDTTTTVEMDPESSSTFDNDYYSILIQNKGLFQSDAALLTAKVSRNIVNELTKQDKFFTEFGQSMKRMGAIEVLTGSDGEIRTKCSVVNS
ncbi:uncharacterized protein LOC114178961 [Vigna unguiculata]|uniref:uncharacterized protein LOC114178961 n=1 Tax=Vigna unguiculata TaxID=3917 RepID=UPI001016AAE7|nr:uncharacterized protein LOC114178961 [Vigna unguiculata]